MLLNFPIRIQINNVTILWVFALLPNKSEATYRAVYGKIKGLVGDGPEHVTSDSEKASIKAVKKCLYYMLNILI